MGAGSGAVTEKSRAGSPVPPGETFPTEPQLAPQTSLREREGDSTAAGRGHPTGETLLLTGPVPARQSRLRVSVTERERKTEPRRE